MNDVSEELKQGCDDKKETTDGGLITDPGRFKSVLDSLINQLCVVRHPQAGHFAGKLQTDGTGFGFQGGIGFLIDSIEKIYPINVPLERNEVRGVVYLKVG